MFSKKYSPIVLVILGSLFLFCIHKSIVLFSDWATAFSDFRFSLESLYLYFSIASLLIVFILIKVKERNFDQIGMTFMVLITIKMASFYFIFKPVISKDTSGSDLERTNFIILFMVFLMFETLVSAQILKSSEK